MLGYKNTKTIQRLVSKKKLGVIGEGPGRRVPRTELEAYIEKTKTKTTI